MAFVSLSKLGIAWNREGVNENDFYSYRNARIGEIREARRAGAKDAASDADNSTPMLTANTGPSNEVTPNSCVSTNLPLQ